MSRLPTRRRRGRPPHPDVLTPAEWRVLEYVRAGLTNAEVAVRLRISPETVKTHVSNMLSKLDLLDRQTLAAWPGEPAAASAAPRRGLLGLGMLGSGFLASKAAKLVAGVGLTAGVTVGVAAGAGALGGSDALRDPSVGQPISGYAVEVLALSIQLEEAFLDPAVSSDAATVEQTILAFADEALALDPPPVPFAAHTRLVTALEKLVAGSGEPTARFLIEPTEEVGAALDRLTQDALAEHDADPLARYLSARIEIGAPSDDVLQAYGVLFSNFAAFPGAVAFRDFLPVFAEARAALEAERSRLAALTPPREAEPLHDRTLVAYRELINVVTADAVVFEEFLTDVRGPAPLPTGLADRLILLRARAEDAVFELGLLALEENELALRVLSGDAR